MERGLVFGLSIGELLTIYDPDSQSWKMSGCLFTGDYARYSEALPKSGIMQNGRIYEQVTWARRIKGKESGLWPTPMIPGNGGMNGKAKLKRMLWPTPDCSDRRSIKSKQQGLSNAVKREMWPTPDANCGNRGTQPEWKPVRESGHTASYTINQAVRDSYPTPTARDWKGGRTPEGLQAAGRNENNSLNDKVNTLEQTTGQLNPQWVDWLMGYPVGWTDLKDSETQLSLK